MKVHIELSEKELRSLILSYIQEKMGDATIKMEDIKIETKSTQNYKSEWENAAFRAIYEAFDL